MTQANDSIVVTPGTGATVATHLVNSKEYQVVMEADHVGHIKGTREGFLALYPTNVANINARRIAEIFNNDTAAIVRIRGIWILNAWNSGTLSTGANITIGIKRTTVASTPSGGTTITPQKLDTSQANINANILLSVGFTTNVPTTSYTYLSCSYHHDDHLGVASGISMLNQLPVIADEVIEIILRTDEGILIQQDLTNTVGFTGALIYFVVE